VVVGQPSKMHYIVVLGPLRAKEGKTQLKSLIACALIAAMSQTAMAQIPEQCINLQNVTDYKFERDNAGNLSLFAFIHNEGTSDVTYAAFYFDFYADEHLKIGEGNVSIGRLTHGDTERVRIYYTLGLKINDIHGIRVACISCTLSG
jgi:hypothetical protein